MPPGYFDITNRVIPPNLTWPPVAQRDAVITVHMRGGNVVSDRNPNLLHWQPSLAIDTKSITWALELTGRSSVQIISIDRVNPVLDDLEEWAMNQGLDVNVSSGSFEADVTRMLSADCLIASNSSLAFGLAFLR